MFATFAKLERERLIERTRAGLRRARALGKTLGRPKLVADRQRIAEMRAAGMSFAKIASELGCCLHPFTKRSANGSLPALKVRH